MKFESYQAPQEKPEERKKEGTKEYLAYHDATYKVEVELEDMKREQTNDMMQEKLETYSKAAEHLRKIAEAANAGAEKLEELQAERE